MIRRRFTKQDGEKLKAIQSNRAFLWLALAIGLFVLQWFVHGAFNSQTVSILPTDGCGQILDNALKMQLELLLRVALLSSLLFSVFFVFTMSSMFWRALFLLLAIAAICGLLIFGWMNLHYYEFLTSCDIFFGGSKAANWNVLAAIVVLSCVVYRLKYQTDAN